VSAEPFQYAIVRVVPQIERAEFINAGVIVFCRARKYLAARTELNVERLRSLDSSADPQAIKAQLVAITSIAAGDPTVGPLAALPQSERFHWLAAPASTVVQTSPTHSGICEDPDQTLDHLFKRLVQR
jgi:DUF3037 family protein